MARRYFSNRIKSNRSYEISEAAVIVGVTCQTVRQWIRDGLPALTDQRPFLIIGRDLKTFLKQREVDRKVPLKADEFFCLSCKKARRAALGITEWTVLPDGRPVLKGFCEVCEKVCQRFLSAP